MSRYVPYRDIPLDPLSERDVLTAKILQRLRQCAGFRFAHGDLSPIEVARYAADEVLGLADESEQVSHDKA